jgi:hypothetical protein
MDPARTLRFADRKIEAFFAGAMHEGKPDNEREIMRATIKQAQLPFVVYRTQGFGQGLSPSSYAAFLGNSRFALVPSGNSPETVRLYDVLEHGCIPIMLKSPFVFAPGALAAIGPPPLILLDSWQDLPVAYTELSGKPVSQLEDQRLRIVTWWTKFKSHQQARVREVIEASFAKTQGTT